MKYILILEDDKEFAKVVSECLEVEGYPSVVISTTKELLPALKSHNIRLILSDIMLDQSVGLDILKLLDYKKISIPIVFMTGFDDIPGLAKAMGDKAVVDVLIKPFNFEHLISLVAKRIA